MKSKRWQSAAAAGGNTLVSLQTIDRREFMAGSVAAGAALLVPGELVAVADGKKTFTILHTNDLHSNLIGMGPASDYTPFMLNDDRTSRRLCAPGDADRGEKGRAKKSGSGASP